MSNLTIYANTGDSDGPLGSSGVIFTELDLSNDYLVFSSGSDTVKDGEPEPSSSDLTQAGIVITDSDQHIEHTFVADISANELKEIPFAGPHDNQYVFAFDFDGATASEPILEIWDDTSMDTINNYSLGEGNATQSWFKGFTTTNDSPGADWEETDSILGKNLAGGSSGHYLTLNDGGGALDAAKTLYCQLKIVVPANFENPGNETPVIVVKYTTN